MCCSLCFDYMEEVGMNEKKILNDREMQWDKIHSFDKRSVSSEQLEKDLEELEEIENAR